MVKYILDTNTISEPLRQKPCPKVIDKLKLHEDEIAISTITLHEMYYGMLRLPESKRKVIKYYIEEVVHAKIPLLSYDDNASQEHAQTRTILESKGLTQPFVDGQIAAIASCNNLVLITRNLRDFKHIKNLKVETWH